MSSPSPEFDVREQYLDDIAFLARSPYRVRVLDTLAHQTLDRNALKAETAVPRITLGRVLTGLQERGWIEQTGRQYTATPIGELINRELSAFLDILATVHWLGSIDKWLPVEAYGFDLIRLANADITLPQAGDPLAPVHCAVEALRDAKQVSILTPVVITDSLEADWEAVVHGEQRFEGVLSAAALETITATPRLTRWLQEMLGTDQATVYRYDGDIPLVLAVTEKETALPLSDDTGLPRALIRTTDATVREWAKSTIAAYRREAESITHADLRE